MDHDNPAENSVVNQSGGVDLKAEKVSIGGDVVGRDKAITAGTYIEHATFVTPAPTTAAAGEPPAPGAPPFKGLQYFDEADADLFFGRELLTAKLVGHLRDNRFLAIVVGASGSGKSSVVRAGIMPALERGAPLADGTLPPAGSGRWPIHVITPTSHPLESLAASLTRDSESVTATTTLIDDMTRDPRSLHLAVRKTLNRADASGHLHGDRLLLIVDQFEELFTLCRDEPERKAFVDNLMTAVAPETDGPTIVVIALRADFYAYCAQYAKLREALSTSQEYIGPMGGDELRRAIEEPAKRGRWEFEPGLVDLIVRDVGDEPGALPLLSHALLATWERRQGRRLTLQGYEASGGVRGAIAKTAETVFSQLNPDQQAIARNIFLRLVELGDGVPDTRRRAALTELVSHPEDLPAIQAVLKVLVDARLITTGEGTVEVAHEALIRGWGRLARWMEADREFRIWHERLRAAIDQWQASGRDDGALLRGTPLAEAAKWQAEREMSLSQAEQAFVRASTDLRVRERAARERLRRRIMAGAVTAAIVLAIVAGVAVVQWQRAEEQRQIAQTRQWAVQAELERSASNGSWTRAALLAVESLRRSDNLEASIALFSVLDRLARPVTRIELAGPVNAIAFSSHNRLMVSGYGRIDQGLGGAVVSDAATGAEVTRLKYDGRVYAVTFSPNGEWVVSGNDDGTARVWNPATGWEITRMAHAGPVNAVDVSPDGRRVASGYGRPGEKTGGVVIWDAATGVEVTRIEQSYAVMSVAFSPDGRWIVLKDENGSRSVWEAATGRESPQTAQMDGLTAVAFSHYGAWLAIGDRRGRLVVRDLTTRREVTWDAHAGPIWNLTVSPDDRWLASGSDDFKVRVWNVPATLSANGEVGVEVARMVHDGRVDSAAFSPDGHWLLTRRGNVARVWEAGTGREVARIEHDGLTTTAFSPDGQSVASAGSDGMVRLWDVSGMLNRGAAIGRPVSRIAEDRNRIDALAISLDGRRALVGGDDGRVRLWNVPSGPGADATFRQEVARMKGAVRVVALSPDGKWEVAGSQDGTLAVWEIATGREAAQIKHGWEANTVAFSPDGRAAVSGAGDGTVLVWEIATGKPVARMDHGWEVNSVVFSADGRRVVSASRNGTVRVWDAATGEPVSSIVLGAQFTTMALSPEGGRLASGRHDGTVQVWESATGREVSRMKQLGEVISVAFSPDGQWVVSSGQVDVSSFQQDGTARVWEAATGREVARIQHQGWADAAGFSPDGRWVTTITYDTALMWWWKPVDLIAQVCSYLTRNFTRQEWRQYIGDDPYRTTCPNLPAGAEQ